MVRTLALVLGLGLVACGGGRTPAAQAPVEEEATATEPPGDPEVCCCDYIEETGDGDTMAENQVYEMLPPDECASMGQCGDDAACAGE